MKKFLSFILSCFILLISTAQVPNQINYQGIARNSVGNVLPNQPITVRLSVRDGSASGTVVYAETRNITTNAFGLFYYGIGSAGATSVTGTLSTVSWATGNKFLQVEIDPKGGTSFTDAGTTQLLSVPYAIYAAGASPTGNAGGSLTGIYPNPTIANGAITSSMIATGVIPTTLPPTGPAGGSLTGTYPNPAIANGAVIQSMIAPGVTLPPNGPAGGSLTGVYPNPVIANGAVTQAMLDPGITLPPTGAAGGDLSGNYPNPTVSKIQGININNTTPVINNILGFDGANWGPVSLANQPDNYWRLNGTSIYNANTGNIGAGTNTPDASAKLDISSSSSGLLIPRMTMTQRDAIASPANSLMIYQTDNTPGYYYYNGSAWLQLATGSSAVGNWSLSGSDIYNNNPGNVGIGTNTPTYKLHVAGGDGYFSDSLIAKSLTAGSSTVPVGVRGTGNSYGVFGTSPNTIGVYGSSLFGTGLYGSGGDYGVNGSSSNIGVYGSGTYSGVFGSGNSYGVYGVSVNSYGVYGTTTNGVGVYGYSQNLKGGYFYSLNENGLWAKTGRGDRNYAAVFEGNTYCFNSYQTSDRNLKKNIEDLGDAMTIINRLKPKIYEFRKDGKLANLNLPEGRHYGVLAQDLEEVLPNLIKDVENEVSVPTRMDPASTSRSSSDGHKSTFANNQMEPVEKIRIKAVNYTELIPIMIKGMQEQQQTIEEQKNKITALEARLARLESILSTSTKK